MLQGILIKKFLMKQHSLKSLINIQDNGRKWVETNPGFDQLLRDAYTMANRTHELWKQCDKVENQTSQKYVFSIIFSNEFFILY